MGGDGQEKIRENNGMDRLGISFEEAVLQRYGKAAHEAEVGLCVPVNYDSSLLKVIPAEILEKDYGCGDPSTFVKSADTVLDLGSGSGKACYIMSQVVGAQGKVIGVDFNPPMLALARKHQKSIGDKLGYYNVEFRRGKIQDLKTDLELVEQFLQRHPVRSVSDLANLQTYQEQIRHEQPLVADESIDVIVSNCVLNLVHPEDKKQLFTEMYRVLKRGGRVVISDIVSDEPVPDHMMKDPELWSGCVSGAFLEEEFLKAFEEAKFYGIHVEDFRSEPYRTVEGIEFRTITVKPTKAKKGPASSAIRRSSTAVRGSKSWTTTIMSCRAACGWRFARKPFKSIPNRHMRISSFSSRRERRCRWKKPVSSTARAIIRDIRARRKALNTKLRMPRLAFAARARPVALRRQTRRHGDQRRGEKKTREHASTINLTFLALVGRGSR